MENLVENIMSGINSLFIFNNVSFPKYFNINKFLFWCVIYATIALGIYRLLKSKPIVFYVFNGIACLICITVSSVFFPQDHEMLYAAEAYLALLLFVCFYLFLLWIPLRLQYDPQAEDKIKEMMQKSVLTEEDVKMLYHLKTATKEAYEKNVQWMLRIDRNTNNEL